MNHRRNGIEKFCAFLQLTAFVCILTFMGEALYAVNPNNSANIARFVQSAHYQMISAIKDLRWSLNRL